METKGSKKVLIKPVGETFYERIERFTEYERGTGCWIWNGCARGKNPLMREPAGQRMVLVRRTIYQVKFGLLTRGEVVHPSCGRSECVSPFHAVAYTVGEFSRKYRRKTHCIKGHELREGNLYWSNAKRRCKTCAKGYQRSRQLGSRRGVV
jgi:hypothetical protein